MIQRIQSLYLLLTSLLPILFLSGTFLKFFNKSGTEYYFNFSGLWESGVTGGTLMISSLIPLSGVMILITILSVTAIIFFKKRKVQMKLVGTIILLTIIFLGGMLFLFFRLSEKFQAEILLVYRMFIPVLILIFGILAYQGIRKDENLVKSLDRLR